ncbi:hypothetical protein DL767_006978 [Monosporascus sp. MG133]|nr:hypothetical protein DL767_006978 [Monosporascus sp. MG133]
MYKFFNSDFYNFEVLRLIGTAPTQGSDVAECLEAIAKIRVNDPENWYKVWSDLAISTEGIGKDALVAGQSETARWAFMRASNYWRSSEFMLRSDAKDPRLLHAISRSVEDFEKACKLLDSPVENLAIPYLDTGSKLPARLFLPKSGTVPNGQKTPVILSTGGFDSTQEEMYHFTASGALTRGYATLTFEGPGQGIVVRRDGLHLRHDWEVVIGAVLDQLFVSATREHPEWNLDLDRIALVGNSMGGYFALRGATDHRIKACVSSDGFYDMGVQTRERTPFWFSYLSDGMANTIMDVVLRFDYRMRWETGHAMLALGVSSMTEALRRLAGFTCEPPSGGGRKIVEDIACPVLVTGAPDSIYTLGTEPAFEALRHARKNVELWMPDGFGNGSAQAKVAALSRLHAKVCEWLDGKFQIDRSPISLD